MTFPRRKTTSSEWHKSLASGKLTVPNQGVFGAALLEETHVYIFQLIGTQELYEVESGDSAEAFRRCLREKVWPIERVAYLGKKESP